MVLAAGLAGCGDDDSSTSSDAGNGGTDAGKDGSTPDKDSGGQSLCEKYGGKDNVGSVVTDKVIPKIAGDCRINAFFASLPSDHLLRLQECLSTQVEELFGCEGVKYTGAKASNGLPCRSMSQAHSGMAVGSADFDALIEDVAAALKEAGVSDDDIAAAAPALVGLKSSIVEKADADEPTKAMCTMDDGGSSDGGN